MLRLHRITLAILIVCAVALSISSSHAQNESLTLVTVTNSDGTKNVTVTPSDGKPVVLTSATQAQTEWNTYEGYLDDAEDTMDRLKYEANVFQAAADGDESGLRALALPVAITAMLRKRPDVVAVTLLIEGILSEYIDNVKRYKYHLQLYDKYGEIVSQNDVLATAFAERDLFWNALAEFEGTHRKKQNATSLEDMQISIPPFGVFCTGGCGDWYYNFAYYIYILQNPDVLDVYSSNGNLIYLWTQQKGVRVATSELSSSALSDQATCDGCSDEYWSCKDKQVKDHEVLHCHKPIEYYGYDRLSGRWGWFTIKVCGETYRKCDDPNKGVHRYLMKTDRGTDRYGNHGYYIKSYVPASASTHGKGKSDPPDVSIYGVNGVGFDYPPGPYKQIDENPNCYECYDGSRYCPDADTNH